MCDEIESKVIEFVSIMSGVEVGQISRETRLDSIGLDSLDAVQLCTDIEDFYDVNLPINLCVSGDETVGALIDKVSHSVAVGRM